MYKKKSDGYTCKKAPRLNYRRPITMDESIIFDDRVKAYFSSHASLAALGRKVKKLKMFEPVTQKVKIAQKTVKYRPTENVAQMHQAMETIFRRHSQTYRHDYQLNWQVLDADMTGRPCGKKANFASKGYFAKQRNRRGRQEGYVLGTWYEEIVVKRLF